MSKPLPIVHVVDGDLDVLRALGRVLSSHGYRVSGFTSAEQCLKSIEESKAACVVVDAALRGSMSGLDLAEAISSSPRAVPVIVISALTDVTLRERALAVGCVAWLEKPVSSELLIDAIRRSGASGS